MNRLFVTVVLYEKKWQESLAAVILENAIHNKKIQLLIYDNSKRKQEDEFFCHSDVTYIHDKTNSGLAEAYNKGFSLAKGHDLLLLLDQDTVLTEEYLDLLLGLSIDNNVGAIVPLVFSEGKQISPVMADRYINRNLVYPGVGKKTSRLMAINSGTAVTINALKKLKGFNKNFPLDFLDHWLFYCLYKEKYAVLVVGEIIEHDLSVMHYQTMTKERYDQIIKSESYFYMNFDKEKQKDHRNQLFLRTIKQLLSAKKRPFYRRTWAEYRSFRKEQS